MNVHESIIGFNNYQYLANTHIYFFRNTFKQIPVICRATHTSGVSQSDKDVSCI